MLIVAPEGLETVPIVTTTGTGPVTVGIAVVLGKVASIAITPETYPAAEPALTTVAG